MATIDTGTMLSLISDSAYKYCLSRHVDLQTTNVPLHLASNDVIMAQTSVTFLLRFDGRRRRQRFTHLPGLAVPVVLGRDFIIQQKLVLALASSSYFYHDSSGFLPFLVASDNGAAHHVAATSASPSGLSTVSGSFTSPGKERRQLEQVLRPFDSIFTVKPNKMSE